MRVYLAGPEVFHPDAVALGAVKKALCRDFGLTGLYPLDDDLSPGTTGLSAAIYRSCLGMIDRAACGIFNVTPFRGPSADVGTIFELGLFVARGKPVFAYTNVAHDLIGRLHEHPGLTWHASTATWRDSRGMAAEDFGNADNLMIDEALAAQGRSIHRRDVPEASRFTAMDGFIACLTEVAALAASGADGAREPGDG